MIYVETEEQRAERLERWQQRFGFKDRREFLNWANWFSRNANTTLHCAYQHVMATTVSAHDDEAGKILNELHEAERKLAARLKQLVSGETG
jgi:hypothetical protein